MKRAQTHYPPFICSKPNTRKEKTVTNVFHEYKAADPMWFIYITHCTLVYLLMIFQDSLSMYILQKQSFHQRLEARIVVSFAW